MITEFEPRGLDNQFSIIGDFNINLLFKGKYIINKIHETKKSL